MSEEVASFERRVISLNDLNPLLRGDGSRPVVGRTTGCWLVVNYTFLFCTGHYLSFAVIYVANKAM